MASEPRPSKRKRPLPARAGVAMTGREAMILDAKGEAYAALQAIHPMNFEAAADHFRQHPLSPEGTTALASLLLEIERKRLARRASSQRRKPENLDDRCAKSACTSYRQLRQKEVAAGLTAGALKGEGYITVDFSQRSIENAFGRLRKKANAQ
jgi:hypothetical protein